MKTDRTTDFLRLAWWLTLVLALGPLWLSTGEVWDGVIGAYGLDRGTYTGIYDWLVPSNWGLVYLMLRAVGWLTSMLHVEPWLCVKLLLTGSVIGISRETRKLCKDLLLWSECDSRVAGLLLLSFPCWYLLYGSTFIYIIFIWLVLVGHRWMHEATHSWQKVAGYGLVLLSFQVNSNFVMVFALEAARWLYRRPNQPWQWHRSLLITGSAVIAYLLLRFVFPPGGTALEYNNIIIPSSAQAFVAILRAALMYLTWTPLILAPGLLAWLLAGRGQTGRTWDIREAMAIGILLAGAPLAYIAVGKGPPLFVLSLPLEWLGSGKHLGRDVGQWIYTTAEGWSTRHAFMLSIPASIATVWALRMSLGSRLATALGQRIWWFAICFAVLLNLAFMTDGHIAKLARMAQQDSIINALKILPPPQSGRVELVISPPQRWSVWTYEANYWMWRAYGKAAWATFVHAADEPPGDVARRDLEISETADSAMRHYYLMGDYLPSRCQTTWSVHLRQHLGAWDLVMQSLGNRKIPAATIVQTSSQCPLR